MVLQPLFGRRTQRAGGSIERLRQVGDDVVDMLDLHRQPHIALVQTGIALLIGRQLRMRVRGRMNGQRARIANIGDMVEELERIDEGLSGGKPVLQLKPHEAAIAAPQIGMRAARGVAGLQARIIEAANRRMLSRKSATAEAFFTCSLIRSGSVSKP